MYLLCNPDGGSGGGGCCIADASALGIDPSRMVRITTDYDLVQDWPWHMVRLCPNWLCLGDPSQTTIPIVYYTFEHARQCEKGIWVFHGAESILITPGPKR
jgi:hypothetical protein